MNSEEIEGGGFEDYDFEEINNKETKETKEKNLINQPNPQQNQIQSGLEKMNVEEKIQNNGATEENNNNKNPFNNHKPPKSGEIKQINLLKKLSEENINNEINNKNSIPVSKSKDVIKIKQIKIIKTQNKNEENNKSIENKEQVISNGNVNLKEEQKQNSNERYNLKALISEKTFETKIEYIINYIKDDPNIKMIRLDNLTNRSYLSSILRCFVSFEELKNFFLEENNGKKLTDSLNRVHAQRLSYAIHKLFAHIYKKVPTINDIYDAESIYKVLYEKNFLFKTETEMNPINCFIEVLTQLHDELNTCNSNYDFKSNENDKNDVIEKGKLDYDSKNNSIISKNFNRFELEEIRCPHCATRKYRFQSFFTFDLDIGNKINKIKKNKIKLYDCLDIWANTNKKKVYCDSNKCHDFTEAESTKSIINAPKIFAFLIDRKNFDKNLMEINFVIDENINLCPYMEYSEKNIEYQLKAIVSILEKKYINFVKIDNIWYAFDDKKIQKVEHDDIFNTHRDSSIQHIPCILLYEFITNNNN